MKRNNTNINISDVMEPITWEALNSSLDDTTNFIGRYRSAIGGGAPMRGGEDIPGLYALRLDVSPSAQNGKLGFRCVFRPYQAP